MSTAHHRRSPLETTAATESKKPRPADSDDEDDKSDQDLVVDEVNEVTLQPL